MSGPGERVVSVAALSCACARAPGCAATECEPTMHAPPVSAHHDVVVEEPLEIRVAGDVITVTMRTPGDDRFLALGFLHAEGIIGSLADVASVYHCGRTDDPSYGNAIEIIPAPGARLDLDRTAHARRLGLSTSACGVCGRDGIADLLARLPTPQALHAQLPRALLCRAPELLQRGQSLFARTGGAHAACAIGAAGELLAHAEDVGRHNAVDKVVGRLLYAGALSGARRPPLLAISSRASFEIVQKAAMAGFACVASVSAPSSLAVATAESAGLTLASFVREGRFTLYAHPERVC
ncbi:MAG: fdhD [Myxococcaceae bacterium]|nr:fdhD [Myxococcaceae bacterium]